MAFTEQDYQANIANMREMLTAQHAEALAAAQADFEHNLQSLRDEHAANLAKQLADKERELQQQHDAEVQSLRGEHVTELQALRTEKAAALDKVAELETVLGGTEAGQALLREKRRAELLAAKERAAAELARIEDELGE